MKEEYSLMVYFQPRCSRVTRCNRQTDGEALGLWHCPTTVQLPKLLLITMPTRKEGRKRSPRAKPLSQSHPNCSPYLDEGSHVTLSR